jgi:hypothetical protein
MAAAPDFGSRPRATIWSYPLGSGRCSFSASVGGAVIQVPISSASLG